MQSSGCFWEPLYADHRPRLPNLPADQAPAVRTVRELASAALCRTEAVAAGCGFFAAVLDKSKQSIRNFPAITC
ncbi:hypothetical protein [Paenibacillus sp. OAS669]|uniref:hypothetical protein n=1 Tax=Paenibacillus sp. OAS669 TaxID=2663821 RepID=UPI001788FFF0|nr:hypothetical protein [Paenibacillus sp. OAS669]MBE1443624.1 hypothetical protein [Paenibacillus sp. OAS669]